MYGELPSQPDLSYISTREITTPPLSPLSLSSPYSPRCSHDTQTTHWDSPRGLRQQKQLKELSAFLQHHKQQLRVCSHSNTTIHVKLLIDGNMIQTSMCRRC